MDWREALVWPRPKGRGKDPNLAPIDEFGFGVPKPGCAIVSRCFRRVQGFLLLAAVLLLVAGAVVLARKPRGATPFRPRSPIPLGFVVLDHAKSRPIPGAALWLDDPFKDALAVENGDGEERAKFTDARGWTTVVGEFDLGKIRNDAWEGRRVRVYGWRVKVSAAGYRTSTTPLFEHTGEMLDGWAPKVKQPVIRLRRESEEDRKLGREADTFVQWYAGRMSLVHCGPRFDALRSWPAFCSRATAGYEAKSGTLMRAGDVLHLKVDREEILRRQDAGVYVWLPDDLLVSRWGRRHYLVPPDRGIAFCNAVNLGEEPRDSEYGDFPLGEGQEGIAVAGLPDVPDRWVPHLLKAPVQGEVTELLPAWKARVNVGRRHGLRPGMLLVSTEKYLFSDQEVADGQETESTVRTMYPQGRYRKIRVGVIVSSRRPPRKVGHR
jgi:hypothetical protein